MCSVAIMKYQWIGSLYKREVYWGHSFGISICEAFVESLLANHSIIDDVTVGASVRGKQCMAREEARGI